MEDLLNQAKLAISQAAEIGFDALYVKLSSVQELGVRVANSAVCRENVLRSMQWVSVNAFWQQREGSFRIPLGQISELSGRLKILRDQMESQPQDKEFILPKSPVGRFQYDLTRSDFLEAYDPEALYPALEEAMQEVRALDLRVTGYVEAKESESVVVSSSGLELLVHDHGMTSGFTVDHPAQVGASGSSQESGVRLDRQGVSGLMGKTVSDACRIAIRNRNPGTLAPGDYTVILHPRAVADITRTALMYQMFSRRKIDEGRTYLSRAKDHLHFPEGMLLTQSPELDLGDRIFEETPYNERYVACEPLHLIADGRLRDMHTGAFWANKIGVQETFQSYFSPPIQLAAKRDEGFSGGVFPTLEALIAGTDHGIFVANTWYLRMVLEMEGTITGMTRDGVFEIRDGKITRPLNNMRWHENPFRVLSQADAATKEQHLTGLSRWAGDSRSALFSSPALRVPRFHFSSETKF